MYLSKNKMENSVRDYYENWEQEWLYLSIRWWGKTSSMNWYLGSASGSEDLEKWEIKGIPAIIRHCCLDNFL